MKQPEAANNQLVGAGKNRQEWGTESGRRWVRN
ncbi:hypothetical protein E2C01_101396 [Portunus trituberculatus]|uniref:Uncharacterized protein n=1 Tax=Portunus trituberculatus TaxID=210409 RepID=A0A5B7K5L7_PORTR|nr:hypothetical protein [Portunus trituberculatus]